MTTGDTRNESERAAVAATDQQLVPTTIKEVEAMVRRLDETRAQRAPVPVENGQLMPRDLDGVQRLAHMMLATGMCPYGIENMPQAVLVICEGLSLGIGPIQATKNIMVVNNRTAIFGDLGVALIRQSGKCAGIDVAFSDLDEKGQPTAKTVATCTMKRVHAPGEVETMARTYSVEDAKKAGLWEKKGKNGQPTPWITNPKRMLHWRAFWFCARDLFADVLKGMAGFEEVADYDAAPVSATRRRINAEREEQPALDLPQRPESETAAPQAA